MRDDFIVPHSFIIHHIMKNRLQEKIRLFNTELHLSMPTASRLSDISSEVGELHKAWLKNTAYGTIRNTPDNRKEIADELGDVLYSVISLAVELELDIDECTEKVLEKYSRRLRQKGQAGSGK